MAIYPTSLPLKSLCPRDPSPRRSYVILSFTTPTSSSTSYDKHCGYIGSLPLIRASLLCLPKLLTLPSIFTLQDLTVLPSAQIHRLGILTFTCHETSINDSLLLRPTQLLSILTITFAFQLSLNMSLYLMPGIITVTGCITNRIFICWSYRLKERMNLTMEPKLPLPSHKTHKSLGTEEGKSSFPFNSSCYRKRAFLASCLLKVNRHAQAVLSSPREDN